MFCKRRKSEQFKKNFCYSHPLRDYPYSITQITSKGKGYNVDLTLSPEHLDALMVYTADLLGEFSYLNPKNFSNYREIISNIAFTTINYDISSKEQAGFLMKQLREKFPEHTIEFSFYSVSNVYDYCAPHALRFTFELGKNFLPTGDIERCTDILFTGQHAKPVIIYSKLEIYTGKLISQFCYGHDTFKKNMKQYTDSINKKLNLFLIIKEKIKKPIEVKTRSPLPPHRSLLV